jgi:hypothetical protein
MGESVLQFTSEKKNNDGKRRGRKKGRIDEGRRREQEGKRHAH